MSWNAAQKRSMAKDIIACDFEHGRALKYLTSKMRLAIVEAQVFAIVRGQATETVRIDLMDDLLIGVMSEIKRLTKSPGFFE